MKRTRFGLLGAKLGHSYSPLIHEYLGDYTYPLFERTEDQVGDFIQNGPFDGLNVTIPYKKTVMPFCDVISPEAQKIGSVNTVLRHENGLITGDNTDFYGFMRMVHACGAEPKGKKALILGSGGSSVTVRAVLSHLGAGEIITISRSGENNYQNLFLHADAQIIVNTTPVGMYPNVGIAPVDLTLFPKCEAVLDIIYNPAKTDLILQAEKLGIACENGLTMLVAQAKKAAELFLETQIPDEKIAFIRAQVESRSKNLALVGMPGCGKSSVGRILAQKLGREFVDLDEAIVSRAGKPIPEIFAQDGEEAFRVIEHEVLVDTAKRSGLVIATGGGIVTRAENKDALLRNSVVMYLRRDLAELSTKGRPVSQREGVAALSEKRAPLYESWCDFALDSRESAAATAQAALDQWQAHFFKEA